MSPWGGLNIHGGSLVIDEAITSSDYLWLQ